MVLSKFNKVEVEIVSDVDTCAETQKYLEKELNEIFNGEATFHSLEEYDRKLEDSIGGNETKI